MVAGLLAGVLLGGCRSCHESAAERGQASRGPKPSADAAVKLDRRLIYEPGGPMHAAAVARVFRRRLAGLGIHRRQVKIAGERITVDLPSPNEQEAREALSGGRLDLYVLSEAQDPLAQSGEALPEALSLHSEPGGGGRAHHYLVGPASAKAKLLALGEDHSTGARTLLGPLAPQTGEPARLRTYYVLADQRARGERVEHAEIAPNDGTPRLTLRFGGAGKSLVAWQSRRKKAFALYVDGQVLATVRPAKPVTDSQLTFALGALGGEAGSQRARSMLAKLDGTALSHEVKRATPPH